MGKVVIHPIVSSFSFSAPAFEMFKAHNNCARSASETVPHSMHLKEGDFLHQIREQFHLFSHKFLHTILLFDIICLRNPRK